MLDYSNRFGDSQLGSARVTNSSLVKIQSYFIW